MIRHIPLLIGVSLLGACAPLSPANSSPPTPSAVTESAITGSIDREIRTIDDFLELCYCPETKTDASQDERTTAYRDGGLIRKIVVARDSDTESMRTTYYFTAEGGLLFATKIGDEQIQRDVLGRRTSITREDARYYFQNGVLVAARNDVGDSLVGTSMDEQELKANAMQAMAQFAH
jgi:hypothetical protein